ncbi:N-acetyltransferase family protein [Pelagibius sp. CAU 1746]|uniref:GNAT family N-acetyltransferase n=1 Tax=Pelagibius sp. CAU 1746 TaxID=3140370 RepID=UPI00325A5A6D
MSDSAAASLDLTVRQAEDDDIPAIQAIYAHHVLHGVASFELEPPDQAEMQRRHAGTLASGLPFLVAEDRPGSGAILGFAYAASYRARPAYRWTLEDSVYVLPGAGGKGIGSALLSELITLCAGLGYRQMVAVIGDSANESSIRLHARHGFSDAGVLKAVGFKHGRWLDSVFMQLALGPGDETPPD